MVVIKKNKQLGVLKHPVAVSIALYGFTNIDIRVLSYLLKFSFIVSFCSRLFSFLRFLSYSALNRKSFVNTQYNFRYSKYRKKNNTHRNFAYHLNANLFIFFVLSYANRRSGNMMCCCSSCKKKKFRLLICEKCRDWENITIIFKDYCMKWRIHKHSVAV